MLCPDGNFKIRLKKLLKKFNLEPKDYQLYYLAFTHTSAANSPAESYELLEFLGDSVILVHVVNALVKKYPEGRVGLLSKAKSQIVSGETLSGIARNYEFDKYVRVDESILKYNSAISSSILADIFEAFVGAIYLDLGYVKVKSFLTKALDEVINIDLQQRKAEDYKSILQEEVQKRYKKIPMYELIKTVGPDHDKTFFVRVKFFGVNMGRGKGKCKKEAEQEAACKTLKRLNYYFKHVDDWKKITSSS